MNQRPYGWFSSALAALVLHDVALVVELLLGQHVGQRRQAVGLDPQNVSRFAEGTVTK